MSSLEQPQASKIVIDTYDLSSCGLGVQRAVVAALLPGVLEKRDFLEQPVAAGTGSNLFSPNNFTAVHFKSDLAVEEFRSRCGLLQRDWVTLHRRVLRLLADFTEISAKVLSKEEFRIVAQKILGTKDIAQQTFDSLYRDRDSYLFRAFISVAHDDRLTWLDKAYRSALLSPKLRREMIKFQARKLKLMADISEHCLCDERAYTDNQVPEYICEEHKKNWQGYLGEDLPPLHDLITGSRQIYLKAAQIVAPSGWRFDNPA
jgi:hypothetical protein